MKTNLTLDPHLIEDHVSPHQMWSCQKKNVNIRLWSHIKVYAIRYLLYAIRFAIRYTRFCRFLATSLECHLQRRANHIVCSKYHIPYTSMWSQPKENKIMTLECLRVIYCTDQYSYGQQYSILIPWCYYAQTMKICVTIYQNQSEIGSIDCEI